MVIQILIYALFYCAFLFYLYSLFYTSVYELCAVRIYKLFTLHPFITIKWNPNRRKPGCFLCSMGCSQALRLPLLFLFFCQQCILSQLEITIIISPEVNCEQMIKLYFRHDARAKASEKSMQLDRLYR